MKNKKLISYIVVFAIVMGIIIPSNTNKVSAATNVYFDTDDAAKVKFTVTSGLSVEIPNQTSSASTLTANRFVNSGKWYWEVAVHNSPSYPTIGVSAFTDVGYNNENRCYYTNDGMIYGVREDNSIRTITGLARYDANSVIGVALDMTNKQITFYNNGTLVKTVIPYNKDNLYLSPAVGNYSSSGGQKLTVNFGASAFKYSIPSGYTAYNNVTNYKVYVSKITIPESYTKDIGETIQLTPTVLPSNATSKTVTYSSSNTSIATVNASGLITAAAYGTATIKAVAADGGKTSAICVVTVNKPDIKVAGVTINADKNTIEAEETLALKAVITPSHATNQSVLWTSSDTDIAVVDTKGVVTGLKEGSASIKVKTVDGSFEAVINITVNAKEPPVPEDILEVVLEPTEQLLLSVSEELLENEEVNWTSSNPLVASVDTNGKITAHAVGKAVITMNNDTGSYQEEINVLVVDRADDYRLAVDLKVEEKCRLTVDGNTRTKKVTWSSADNTIATVTSKGTVKAMAKGLVIVTALDDKGNEKQVYVRVR